MFYLFTWLHALCIRWSCSSHLFISLLFLQISSGQFKETCLHNEVISFHVYISPVLIF